MWPIGLFVGVALILASDRASRITRSLLAAIRNRATIASGTAP
jgi:hypothetical protein